LKAADAVAIAALAFAFAQLKLANSLPTKSQSQSANLILWLASQIFGSLWAKFSDAQKFPHE